MAVNYIVQIKDPPASQRVPIADKPGRPGRPDNIQQRMVGQFPLSYNVDTRVFALGGSRLTAAQWIDLRAEVDNFLAEHNLIDKFEVHDFRLSLPRKIFRIARWLTRR